MPWSAARRDSAADPLLGLRPTHREARHRAGQENQNTLQRLRNGDRPGDADSTAPSSRKLPRAAHESALCSSPKPQSRRASPCPAARSTASPKLEPEFRRVPGCRRLHAASRRQGERRSHPIATLFRIALEHFRMKPMPPRGPDLGPLRRSTPSLQS